MSESWEVLASSAGLHAAVRTFDEPLPWWRWPLLTGTILGVAVTIRSAALPLIPVAILALLLNRQRPRERGRRQWRARLAAAGAAVLVLLAFASANATFGERFNIAPSPGWYLYGLVALSPTASSSLLPQGPRSCARGAQSLSDRARPTTCSRRRRQRRALRKYRYRRRVGRGVGKARSSRAVWRLREHGVALPAQLLGSRIDAGAASVHRRWSRSSARLHVHNVFYAPSGQRSLEVYYDHFAVRTRHWTLQALHDWQRVVRFGATALFVTTLLTLIGLVIGTRRSRVGVLLFGLGGLSLIAAPALSGSYTGRYTVPMAGPLMAAAAITACEAWRALRRARRSRAAR